MILVGIGSNLAAPGYSSPLETARATLTQLPAIGAAVVASSPWYLSAPVPISDQPWFANAVARVATELPPGELLARLLALEARFGRLRGERDAARTLDLDLLDYDGRQCATPDLELPHPRLHQRRFVLAPLCDIAPQWRHPAIALSAAELLARLPPGQPIRRLGMRPGIRLGDCG
ncbi:MAG: 2-amino-4-hydroxy-6-hydroxymethyldihydropteridine diphosphokinase [Alphaproteobacteria bacterium]|nr:2-amino-4-hydroxy-6-hydroxymethyldihydropteridine diphosphokinase [Alphaproteobacteria bacterium]